MIFDIIIIFFGTMLIFFRKGMVNDWIGNYDYFGIYNTERKKSFAEVWLIVMGIVFIGIGISLIIVDFTNS